MPAWLTIIAMLYGNRWTLPPYHRHRYAVRASPTHMDHDLGLDYDGAVCWPTGSPRLHDIISSQLAPAQEGCQGRM